MALQLIPAGRTSIVAKGDAKFQIQTEYAASPHPRITTTIFSQGRVLHKIEKGIEKPIESIEEMHHIEDIIRSQHNQIAKTLRDHGLPTQTSSITGAESELGRMELIQLLEEVELVLLVTAEGKIGHSREITKEFKRSFKHIVRELPQLITVFASLQGNGDRREEGIFEVEPGRIILVSTGVDFYLILLRPGTPSGGIKEKLRKILAD